MQIESGRLENFTERLCEQVRVLSDCFVVYKYIRYSTSEEARGHKLQLFGQYGFFFGSIQHALYRYLNVTIVNLVDSKDSYGITKYLESCQQNLKSLCADKKKCDAVKSEIDKQKESIKSLNCLDSINSRRNNTDAHFGKNYLMRDKKIDDDFPVDFTDLQKAIELFRNILDWHRENVFGTSPYSYPDLKDSTDPRKVLQDLAVATQLYNEDYERHSAIASEWHRRLDELS